MFNISPLNWRRGRSLVASNSTSLCGIFVDFVMASALPHFGPFDIHADSAIAQRWRKWIRRLENLFIVAAITDKKRLLLCYAGEEVREIVETLSETGEDFATAKEKLTEYFDPEKNVEYEIYKFRQVKQNSGESMSAYHFRLLQLATTCEFADVNKEIKSQIILSCSSQRLRRKALRDTNLTLETLLSEARALETVSSSDGKYTFKLESTTSKGSAPFVSLKVNDVSCKFLVDSGASVNIVSFNASRAFGVAIL